MNRSKLANLATSKLFFQKLQGVWKPCPPPYPPHHDTTVLTLVQERNTQVRKKLRTQDHISNNPMHSPKIQHGTEKLLLTQSTRMFTVLFGGRQGICQSNRCATLCVCHHPSDLPGKSTFSLNNQQLFATPPRGKCFSDVTTEVICVSAFSFFRGGGDELLLKIEVENGTDKTSFEFIPLSKTETGKSDLWKLGRKDVWKATLLKLFTKQARKFCNCVIT